MIGEWTTVARFAIRRLRCVAPDGSVLGAPPPWLDDADALVALYRNMQLTRRYDAKAVALQRSGRLGTFASSLGEEAAGTGVAAAMRPEDVLVPSFRDQSAMFWRGVTPTELFLYWGGDERGSDFAGPREDFPVSIPVGGHAPHAVGVALAFQLRREPRVAVCFLGDGATSKGDVYEAMNIAGVWRLPVLFVVVDNEWAISVPRSGQSAAETLAQKAIASGFPGCQVDGNDVVAVRHAAGEAIEDIRAGGGPRLLEALTYRLADHTTADDARRYRPETEVSGHWAEDPIPRLRALMVARGIWGRDAEEEMLRTCTDIVDTAADTYLATPPQAPETMFDHLHATLPAAYAAQREEMLRWARHGD